MRVDMEATVSFIVPVYNSSRFLPLCIDSILSQTFSDLEIILIDDGSTDGSAEICDEYSKKDGRVKVIHQANAGVSAARNVGIDTASGKYFILCDSDDMIRPDLAEETLRIAEKGGFDCVVYEYESIAESTEKPVCTESTGLVEEMTSRDALETVLIGKKFRMLAWNKLYSRELWNGIRFPVGRKYGDDSSVTYLLLDKCSKIGYLHEKLYFYRMNSESALHKKVSIDNFQLFDAYNELVDYINDKHPDLLRTAYYAYSIRVFDFLPRLKEVDNIDFFAKKLCLYIKPKKKENIL